MKRFGLLAIARILLIVVFGLLFVAMIATTLTACWKFLNLAMMARSHDVIPVDVLLDVLGWAACGVLLSIGGGVLRGWLWGR